MKIEAVAVVTGLRATTNTAGKIAVTADVSSDINIADKDALCPGSMVLYTTDDKLKIGDKLKVIVTDEL